MLRTVNRGQRAITETIPAPVAGWNARDGKDSLEPDEALSLVNWFPGQGKCTLRKGFTSHATGLGGSVDTVGEFNAGSSRKMFAAANGVIWDTTNAGAGSSLATGFTSNRWQWAQFDDSSGGARVGLVNGSDAPQIHTGSAVSAMTISGSGLTPANLDGINIFKGRSYFWDSGTQDFWYSASNALGGALTKFPLGRVHGTGGNLVAMGTWSRDGGDGPDDLAAFILSSGTVIVYAGSNPGDASAWSLVGVYQIGAPMGVRACQKIGADLVIATKDGYVPMSRVIGAGRAKQADALSDRIREAVLYATRTYASNFGWQVMHYPAGNYALFNVPLSSTGFEQHVVNTLTGAWCKFQGMNARTFGMFNDALYFGGSGIVYKADNGRSDAGAAIAASGECAWNYLGRRKTRKQFTAIRARVEADGAFSYSLGVAVDFGRSYLQQVDSSVAGNRSPWDTSPWDTSPWSDETAVSDGWESADGDGYAVSVRVDVLTSTRAVNWFASQAQYLPSKGGF